MEARDKARFSRQNNAHYPARNLYSLDHLKQKLQG